MVLLLAFTEALAAATPATGAMEHLASWSGRMQSDLRSKVLPYWYDTTVDLEHGGYVLNDTLEGASESRDKMIVSQARMLWGFSHASVKALNDPQRDYLRAARQGYEFIRDHFHDAEHGGYFTTTDIAGDPIDRRKTLYAQSFVIFSFIEYFRASADVRARNDAVALFRLIQKHAHDSRSNGWYEHFEPDWTVMTRQAPGAYAIEVPGYKSANAHLHWMEALTALYQEYPDAEVRQALTECLEVSRRYFYPKEPDQAVKYRYFDWRQISDEGGFQISYGHTVEFAWLMIDAQRAIGLDPAWDHFHAIIDHALEHGFDHARGGLYDRDFGDKVWWVQAEMMVALTYALRNQARTDYGIALHKLNNFVWEHMVNPPNGIWVDTVSARGRVVRPILAGNWKAAYHDVRAMVKYYETFGSGNQVNPLPGRQR